MPISVLGRAHPAKGSEFHVIAWKRADAPEAPEVLNVAAWKLKDPAVQQALYQRTNVYGRKGKADHKRNAKLKARTDGGKNFASQMQALVMSCDIAGGFVGKPIGDGGDWHRYSAADLNWRAYRDLVPGEVSLKRGERHLRRAVALGWVTVREISKPTPAGPRAKVAVRRVTDPFFAELGLTKLLAKARREIGRKKAAARLQRVKQVIGKSPIKKVVSERVHAQEDARIVEANLRAVLAKLAEMNRTSSGREPPT